MKIDGRTSDYPLFQLNFETMQLCRLGKDLGPFLHHLGSDAVAG
jgi:hypothetical protein